MTQDAAAAWWHDAVIYQAYVRSFADSDGDGVGDLRGLTARLDHLAWLGVDAVWLSPVHPSPNADWGYDVADYRAVDPALGTLADLDALVAAAGDRGIRILLDLVPNHTSDRHPWFIDARSSRTSRHRDWYVWRDPAPGGGPPNNWVDFSGGPAWTLDELTGQMYLHNFLPEQPDLDWWNPDVRDEFDRIMRFWYDRGVAGFRIDTCNIIVKDRHLRDNPPLADDDHPATAGRRQRQVYSANRPEVHQVLRRWRRVADAYTPPRLLLGETWVFDLAAVAGYHDSGRGIHLAMDFRFLYAPLRAAALRVEVEAVEAAFEPGAWPAWMASTHDNVRFPTRWCDGDPDAVRCALVVLLTLRGTPILFQGDEIGMPQVDVPLERVRDPLGRRGPEASGRDGARTPMRWEEGPTCGFCPDGVEPWLPVGAADLPTVAGQRGDPGSPLRLCRDLIALRRCRDDLRTGAYASLPAPEGAWVWRRGEATTVAVNLGVDPVDVEGLGGTVVLATRREREGTRVAGPMRLAGREAAVVAAPR